MIAAVAHKLHRRRNNSKSRSDKIQTGSGREEQGLSIGEEQMTVLTQLLALYWNTRATGPSTGRDTCPAILSAVIKTSSGGYHWDW